MFSRNRSLSNLAQRITTSCKPAQRAKQQAHGKADVSYVSRLGALLTSLLQEWGGLLTTITRGLITTNSCKQIHTSTCGNPAFCNLRAILLEQQWAVVGCLSVHPAKNTMATPSTCWREGNLSTKVSALRSLAAVVLLLLLSRAEGLVTAPSFVAHSVSMPSLMADRFVGHVTSTGGTLPRRRPRGWTVEDGEAGGAFRRSWRRAAPANARLRMANPEGTQQLRDRDLEFMFYDEAQVLAAWGRKRGRWLRAAPGLRCASWAPIL